MKKHEIEEWALRAIARVKAKQPVEDDRIELKAEWPSEPSKGARRVAAHANVAHGEPILWLIGVDESSATVTGAAFNDPAQWWPQVESCFEPGLGPRLITHLNIEIDGKTVVALLFETDRLPYLVKNPLHGTQGSVEFEVPWRDGTRVRTARHGDLVLMLSPVSRLPSIEVLGGTLTAIAGRQHQPTQPCHWRLELHLYVVPQTRDTVVVAFHHCQVSFRIADAPGVAMTHVRFKLLRHSQTIRTTDYEAIAEGPGSLTLQAEGDGPSGLAAFESDAVVEVKLRPAGSDLSVPVAAVLRRRQLRREPEEPSHRDLRPEETVLAQWTITAAS